MLRIEGFSRSHILPVMLVLIIGMITGWLGFILFGDFASNTSIVYVSAKEVLKLEKDRIASTGKERVKVEESRIEGGKKESSKNRKDDSRVSTEEQIFYGYPDQALKLMEKVAPRLSTKRTKVVFASDAVVKGEMVSSRSGQVHAKVLKIIKGKLDDINTAGTE